MNIKLTCGCGQAHHVPIALAGKTLVCDACRRSIPVPALGIGVPSGKRPPPAHSEPSPFASLRTAPLPTAPLRTAPLPAATRRRTAATCATSLALIVAGLLLLTAGSIAVWRFGLRDSSPVNVVAQSEPLENKPAPAVPTVQTPPEPEPPPRIQVPLPQEPAAPVNKPIAAPITPPIAPPPTTVKPVPMDDKKPAVVVALPKGPFRAGDTLLQDVLVTQKSRFLVQGIPVATLLQYRVVSRCTIEKVDDDGLSVKQKIESATLLQADELTQGLLAGPLAQLPGTAFAMKIGPRGEVTQFAGAGGAMQAGVATVPGGLGVQMASLLDTDGWKELAQATFYQPEERARAGQWKRPLTHNWGPLGSWAGDVTYAYPGPDKAAQVKVPYTLRLAYQPPRGPGALPLQITASKFQPVQAGGVLLFDTRQGRTVAAEERFAVRGAVVLMLLGQNTPAEVEEEQLFQMRLAAK